MWIINGNPAEITWVLHCISGRKTVNKKVYQVSVLLPEFNTKWIQPSFRALGSDHAQNSMQLGMRWIHRALLASPHFQELQ